MLLPPSLLPLSLSLSLTPPSHPLFLLSLPHLAEVNSWMVAIFSFRSSSSDNCIGPWYIYM